MSASKICVETATHPPSTPTNLQGDIKQEVVTSDVGGASSKNSQYKDVDCGVSSHNRGVEEKTKYMFGAAELILNICKLPSRKLAAELLQFLSLSKLTLEDYKTSVSNVRRCEVIISERFKEKCLNDDMVLANISTTSSVGVVENNTFFLRNTQGIIKKQLDLSWNDKIGLRPCVQDDTPTQLLHSKFCKNARHEP